MPYAPAGLYPADSGHVDVEEYRLVVNHMQADQSILSVARLTYIEPEGIQRCTETAPQCGVIFYD
jgi:hypothetical protein